AGQAGLAIGYYLKQFNHSFLILDKSQEAGEGWDKRYDSLVLFTPRAYSALPGLDLKGDPEDFPTKDEISQYIKVYAESFNLPIKYKTNVTDVQRKNNIYYISTESTENMEYKAENIIMTTGVCKKHKISDLSNKLSKYIDQLNSSEYQNPSQLKECKVLVVGGGNSRAQIALELSQEIKTFLSTNQ